MPIEVVGFFLKSQTNRNRPVGKKRKSNSQWLKSTWITSKGLGGHEKADPNSAVNKTKKPVFFN